MTVPAQRDRLSGPKALVACEKKELGSRHARHLHQPEHLVVVDLAEMVSDGLPCIDHRRAALAPEGHGLEPGRRLIGADKTANSPEDHPNRTAPGECRPSEG